MKNKAEDSIFRKKGFFVALYSSLGAVAVLALVITLSNLGTDSYDGEASPVGADQVLPYLDQAQARVDNDEEAWFRPRPTPTPPPMPTPTPVPQPRSTPIPPPTPMPDTQNEVIPEPTPPPVAPPVPQAEATPPPVVTQAETPPAPQAEAPPQPAPVVVPTFAPFKEGDRMIWPVLGEIVMDFSPDVLTFHPTFERFQTNESLLITSREGTPVRAGADGRVVSIGHSVDWGNYITVDHGNGWLARYGQLMDVSMVNVGEIVRTAQVIGGVGQPSYFGTNMGTHFNFYLTHEGEPVNPHHILAERDM